MKSHAHRLGESPEQKQVFGEEQKASSISIRPNDSLQEVALRDELLEAKLNAVVFLSASL